MWSKNFKRLYKKSVFSSFHFTNFKGPSLLQNSGDEIDKKKFQSKLDQRFELKKEFTPKIPPKSYAAFSASVTDR